MMIAIILLLVFSLSTFSFDYVFSLFILRHKTEATFNKFFVFLKNFNVPVCLCFCFASISTIMNISCRLSFWWYFIINFPTQKYVNILQKSLETVLIKGQLRKKKASRHLQKLWVFYWERVWIDWMVCLKRLMTSFKGIRGLNQFNDYEMFFTRVAKHSKIHSNDSWNSITPPSKNSMLHENTHVLMFTSNFHLPFEFHEFLTCQITKQTVDCSMDAH